MDNLDGKQARKTGNSSPVGMLFDHGSDSLVCVMLAGNLTCMLAMGNSFWGIVYVFIGCSPFYFSTLESYYLGGVYLPVVHGVSDGSVV